MNCDLSELTITYSIEIYSETQMLDNFFISYLSRQKNDITIFEFLDNYIEESLKHKVFNEQITNINIQKYYTLYYE